MKKTETDTDGEAMTYGIELEKAFSAEDGQPYGVGDQYFERLAAAKRERGQDVSITYIDGVAVGVKTPYGEEALDNGFNLGESATGPITGKDGGLHKLHEVVTTELNEVIAAVEADGAMVLNMSNHPLTPTDQPTYAAFVAPKPAYGYVRDERGWNHAAGINARAQNSPSFGITSQEAIPAVNVMIGLGSVLIALYANSPFENGRVTTMQESRMNVWHEMFGSAHVLGDRQLHTAPAAPFNTMRDYFTWMFGEGTNMFFVPNDTGDIKKAMAPVIIDGNPPLLTFLAGTEHEGTVYGSGERVRVKPELGHLVMHQFMQFSGARIRFAFTDPSANLAAFMRAMRGTGSEVESFFESNASGVYIEGRDPGANFADRALMAEDPGAARSVLISPAAIQAGLLRNLPEAQALLRSYEWGDLMALRKGAAVNGLEATVHGVRLAQLAGQVLQVAASGLHANEQWMLAYPEHVLDTGENGAVRALELYAASTQATPAGRIQEVLRARRAIQLTV